MKLPSLVSNIKLTNVAIGLLISLILFFSAGTLYLLVKDKNKSDTASTTDIVIQTDTQEECIIATDLQKALQNPTRVCILDLSGKGLTELPAGVNSFSNMKTINLSHNNFTEFPEPLLTMPHLTEINISLNQVENLPEEISTLSNLQVLDISLNNIITLPPQINQMSQLKTLKIQGNGVLQEEINSLTAQNPTLKIEY